MANRITRPSDAAIWRAIERYAAMRIAERQPEPSQIRRAVEACNAYPGLQAEVTRLCMVLRDIERYAVNEARALRSATRITRKIARAARAALDEITELE